MGAETSIRLPAATVTALASAISSAITGSTTSQVFQNAGAPVSGGSGTYAGVAILGALLYDTTNFILYANEGTLASPTWAPVSSDGVNALGTKTTAATLKLGLNTVTLTNAQTCVLTMPTVAAGAKCKLVAHQSAVSSFNGVITHTGVKYAGGTIPTMTATSGAIDMYEYYSDGTIWILTNAQQAIA